MRAGGLELCGCRISRERAALLEGAGLPRPAGGELPAPAELAAWFARYRPEPDWPWLLATDRLERAVIVGLAQLVTGAGIPVDTVTPGVQTGQLVRLRRVVACVGLEGLGVDAAEELVAHCERGSLTLVATAARVPFPLEGGGLEQRVGERAALALVEHGIVVS